MQSEMFTTREGVRQGGAMSPLLFITVMADIIKESKELTSVMYIGYRNLQKVSISECAFADDIYGMTLNKSKTKVLVVSKERIRVHIQVDWTEIEQVTNYKYLGITLEENGENGIEVTERIDKANKTYYSMNKGFINRREISRKTKMSVYKLI
nr:unnamed protein product [Callosobruchus chinensis]